MDTDKKNSNLKKKGVSKIAQELEEEKLLQVEVTFEEDIRPPFTARTYERNFKALLDTLHIEEGRFKDDRGWYMVNAGTEPVLKVLLEETTIKGSYFYNAKNNHHHETKPENIVATYLRMEEYLVNNKDIDESFAKQALKVIDKTICYSTTVQKLKIQAEIDDLVSTIQTMSYSKQVSILKDLEKQVTNYSLEIKRKIQED